MKAYQTKAKSIPGTDFREVHKKAFGLFAQIKKRSKRRTYVRSAYFDKDKIFLDIFGVICLENQTGGIVFEE